MEQEVFFRLEEVMKESSKLAVQMSRVSEELGEVVKRSGI